MQPRTTAGLFFCCFPYLRGRRLGRDSVFPLRTGRKAQPSAAGINTSGTGKRPEYTYSEAGTFNVTLKVKDDGGKASSDNAKVEIGQSSQKPTADAGGDYEATVGVELKFDGRDSTDPDGELTNFKWDYGDGNGGNGKRPQHSYDEARTYTVTLTVTDDDQAKDSDNATVVVTE